MLGKIVAGIIGGFLVAFLASNIATLAISKSVGAMVLLPAWGVCIYKSIKSEHTSKAWRWLLISSGCLSFVVPLATLIFSAKKESGAEIIGGMAAAGIFGVVFFLFGLALLVVGLLIGRNKTVVVVESASKNAI